MTVLNENGFPMRFYGRVRSTNEQVVFVTLDVSGKPDFVKAILFKRIPAALQGEFTSIINSHECQTLKTKPLYEFLQTKMFSTIPDKNVYAALIGMSVVKDLPKNEVLVECPNDEYRTVDEIRDFVNQAKSMKMAENKTNFGEVQESMTKRETILNQRLDQQDVKIDTLVNQISTFTDVLNQLKGTLTGINDKFTGLENKFADLKRAQKPTPEMTFAPNVPVAEEANDEDWQTGLPPIVS